MMHSDEIKGLTKSRYNQFAKGYVESVTHATGSELDKLVAIAQPQSGWLMLDVATGGGHTTLKFAPHVAKVTATDLTPNMLAAAQAFMVSKGVTNATFRAADAENLPFDDGSFHLVTCRIAAHHFPNADRFVQEAARVLKAGGLLLVQDQVLPEDAEAARYVDAFEKHRDPSHNRAFTEAEWIQMFTHTRLAIEHCEQIIKRHGLFEWAERQGCTPEVIAELETLLVQAGPIASAWMDAQNLGMPEVSFCNHHLIIAGRKR